MSIIISLFKVATAALVFLIILLTIRLILTKLKNNSINLVRQFVFLKKLILFLLLIITAYILFKLFYFNCGLKVDYGVSLLGKCLM
jgi:hypothetical protein